MTKLIAAFSNYANAPTKMALTLEHTGWAKSRYTVITVKNKVYERKPQPVDEMKEFITDAFMDTDSDRKLCRTVCQSV